MQMTFRIDNALVIVGFKGTYEELDKLIEEATYTGFALQLGVLPTKENHDTNKGFIGIKNKLSDTIYNLDVRTTLDGIHFPDILILGLNSARPVIKKPTGLTATVEDLYLALQEYRELTSIPIDSNDQKYVFVIPGIYEAFQHKEHDLYFLKGSWANISVGTFTSEEEVQVVKRIPSEDHLMDTVHVKIGKYIKWKFNRRLKDGYRRHIYNTLEEMMADI